MASILVNSPIFIGNNHHPLSMQRVPTERDGGGHVVSCVLSRLNELYDLNGCFAIVTVISTRKIILFLSITASLEAEKV